MTEQKKWKIEGADFDAIKPILDKRDAFIASTMRDADLMHDELWEKIKEITGMPSDANTAINEDHVDLGILIIEEKSRSGLKGLFDDLISDIIKAETDKSA